MAKENKYTQQALKKANETTQTPVVESEKSPVNFEKNKLEQDEEFVFTKKNYMVFLAGILIVAIGFVIMSGGGSDDITIFNEEVINSTRIVVAPITVLIGFIVVGISIFIKDSSHKTNS